MRHARYTVQSRRAHTQHANRLRWTRIEHGEQRKLHVSTEFNVHWAHTHTHTVPRTKNRIPFSFHRRRLERRTSDVGRQLLYIYYFHCDDVRSLIATLRALSKCIRSASTNCIFVSHLVTSHQFSCKIANGPKRKRLTRDVRRIFCKNRIIASQRARVCVYACACAFICFSRFHSSHKSIDVVAATTINADVWHYGQQTTDTTIYTYTQVNCVRVFIEKNE